MKGQGKGRRGGEARARRQEKERLSPDEKTEYQEVSCTQPRSENWLKELWLQGWTTTVHSLPLWVTSTNRDFQTLNTKNWRLGHTGIITTTHQQREGIPAGSLPDGIHHLVAWETLPRIWTSFTHFTLASLFIVEEATSSNAKSAQEKPVSYSGLTTYSKTKQIHVSQHLKVPKRDRKEMHWSTKVPNSMLEGCWRKFCFCLFIPVSELEFIAKNNI